jgi:hypothetical protein
VVFQKLRKSVFILLFIYTQSGRFGRKKHVAFFEKFSYNSRSFIEIVVVFPNGRCKLRQNLLIRLIEVLGINFAAREGVVAAKF